MAGGIGVAELGGGRTPIRGGFYPFFVPSLPPAILGPLLGQKFGFHFLKDPALGENRQKSERPRAPWLCPVGMYPLSILLGYKS